MPGFPPGHRGPPRTPGCVPLPTPRTHHVEDGGVAADDEGEAAEALDAVGDAHRQLLLEVAGALLQWGGGAEEGQVGARVPLGGGWMLGSPNQPGSPNPSGPLGPPAFPQTHPPRCLGVPLPKRLGSLDTSVLPGPPKATWVPPNPLTGMPASPQTPGSPPLQDAGGPLPAHQYVAAVLRAPRVQHGGGGQTHRRLLEGDRGVTSPGCWGSLWTPGYPTLAPHPNAGVPPSRRRHRWQAGGRRR